MDLTGKWVCNDGGDYYIRQLDKKIWWYGQRGYRYLGKTVGLIKAQVPAWSNVANGTILGSKITLAWADVPNGHTGNMGRLTLNIISNDELAVDVNHPDVVFGGTHWKRWKPLPPPK